MKEILVPKSDKEIRKLILKKSPDLQSSIFMIRFVRVLFVANILLDILLLYLTYKHGWHHPGMAAMSIVFIISFIGYWVLWAIWKTTKYSKDLIYRTALHTIRQ